MPNYNSPVFFYCFRTTIEDAVRGMANLLAAMSRRGGQPFLAPPVTLSSSVQEEIDRFMDPTGEADFAVRVVQKMDEVATKRQRSPESDG